MLRLSTVTLLLAAALALPAAAGDALSYQMPAQVLADMIDAAPTPGVAVSPDGQWLVLLERPGLPPISEVAMPELRLAGLRINPRTDGPSRGGYLDGLTFQRLQDGKQVPVTGLPDGARLSSVSWSPDGERIAFVVLADDKHSLWYADLGDGRARRVTPEGMALNGVYGQPYDWLRDGKNLVVRAVPADRGPSPEADHAPSGPVVQENLGKTAPARTLQDLLQNPHDEALFDHHATSQLHVIALKGKARAIGEPAVVSRMDPSPDGNYLLTTTIHRPYSYSLQQNRFPSRTEVWHLKRGEVVHVVADLPLQDQIPISFGSVATGPRSVQWRSDAAAELVWAEALDGGDGGAEAQWRDRVVTLSAPFDGEPRELITLAQRYGGVMWGRDDLAFVTSWWWATRNMKTWWVQPGHRDREAVLVEDRSWQDRYNDPGQPMMHRGEYGRQVMLTADRGRTLFLSGAGASPEGDRPFLDAWDLQDRTKDRLFRSEAPYYESVVELLDADRRLLLTRRESQTEPPNYLVRDLRQGTLEQKTFFPDPTPQLAGISKELITYERGDGVQLTGTLYLPAGYDPERDGPLPVLMWAYPTEFKSKDDAGQVTDSPYRFTRVGWWSPMLFLTRGYAVLDDPTMPIVGEGDQEPNDTFAIGGHSYGAFMTANLLAHSDLFRAGLPRSGAYNRTLTPFGFQAEERSLWEAPEVYMTMSPFMHAEKIDEPILLVHGDADNNSGTYPLQSERMYGALKGHGATARLVMLPHESHGYRARESIMHLLWETDRWLEEYVKEAGPRTLGAGEDGS